MKNEYSIRIFVANPRNNHTINCDNKRDAVETAKMHTGDDPGGRLIIYRNGEVMAFRSLTESRLSWK